MSDTIPTPARTVEDRLDSIEANTAILIDAVRAIATELGIREEVRGHIRRLSEANGHHDSEPAGPEGA